MADELATAVVSRYQEKGVPDKGKRFRILVSQDMSNPHLSGQYCAKRAERLIKRRLGWLAGRRALGGFHYFLESVEGREGYLTFKVWC